MDAKTINRISQQVAHQFPEVGREPSVKPQAGAKSSGGTGTYLLTYTKRLAAPSGASFNRTVRVVADESGRILKITTSR